MLTIAMAPFLDKATLVGGCLRLDMTIDGAGLRDEVERLPEDLWHARGPVTGPQRDTRSIFMRGYAPGEGDKPFEDRPVLERLPRCRALIETAFGSTPLRCLLARLPAGGFVPEHVDAGVYFAKTIRLHVPIITHPRAWMMANGFCYRMAVNEVWALNNSAPHGVWNADPVNARTHMICDFLLTPELGAMLARGDRNLGTSVPEVEARIRAETAQRIGG